MKGISPYVTETLEYAEALRLLCDRRDVEAHLHRIDKALKLVRRISPAAVEQARRDMAECNHVLPFDFASVVDEPP
jgi:hypothetical protein